MVVKSEKDKLNIPLLERIPPKYTHEFYGKINANDYQKYLVYGIFNTNGLSISGKIISFLKFKFKIISREF